VSTKYRKAGSDRVLAVLKVADAPPPSSSTDYLAELPKSPGKSQVIEKDERRQRHHNVGAGFCSVYDPR